MLNLEKELKKKASIQRADMEQFSAVTETTRLIAEKGAEDMAILREMGMHTSVVRAIDAHAKKIELFDLEKKYGKVFSESEIKEVACKFALKFLRSDKYKGEIDPEMLVKIKEFFKDSGMEYNKAQAGYKFFILAPAKSFNLRTIPEPPKDPILFYRLDGDNYRMIHKWGADLTIYRRLVGWKYASKFNYFMTWFSFLSIPAAILWTCAFHFKWYNIGTGALLTLPGVLTVAAVIAASIRSEYFRAWSKKEKFIEEEVWRSDSKVKL